MGNHFSETGRLLQLCGSVVGVEVDHREKQNPQRGHQTTSNSDLRLITVA